MTTLPYGVETPPHILASDESRRKNRSEFAQGVHAC